MQTEFEVNKKMFIYSLDIEKFSDLNKRNNALFNLDYHMILYFENGSKEKSEHILFVPGKKSREFQLPKNITGKAVIFKETFFYKEGNEDLLFKECSLYSNNYFLKNDDEFFELKKIFMMLVSEIQYPSNRNQESIMQNYLTKLLLIKKKLKVER